MAYATQLVNWRIRNLQKKIFFSLQIFVNLLEMDQKYLFLPSELNTKLFSFYSYVHKYQIVKTCFALEDFCNTNVLIGLKQTMLPCNPFKS